MIVVWLLLIVRILVAIIQIWIVTLIIFCVVSLVPLLISFAFVFIFVVQFTSLLPVFSAIFGFPWPLLNLTFCLQFTLTWFRLLNLALVLNFLDILGCCVLDFRNCFIFSHIDFTLSWDYLLLLIDYRPHKGIKLWALGIAVKWDNLTSDLGPLLLSLLVLVLVVWNKGLSGTYDFKLLTWFILKGKGTLLSLAFVVSRRQLYLQVLLVDWEEVL